MTANAEPEAGADADVLWLIAANVCVVLIGCDYGLCFRSDWCITHTHPLGFLWLLPVDVSVLVAVAIAITAATHCVDNYGNKAVVYCWLTPVVDICPF